MFVQSQLVIDFLVSQLKRRSTILDIDNNNHTPSSEFNLFGIHREFNEFTHNIKNNQV